METTKGRLIGFWVLTGLICLSQSASGIMEFLGAESVAGGVAILGYPPYVLYILGFWKLAAVPALLVPGLPLLKEWAYAGLFFVFSGAFVSHALNGDGIEMLTPPLLALAILIGSYLLRPPSRRLATA